MKKKGFTLVELLAVIVILAVIALIATPTILGIIGNAQRGALQDSAYGLVQAADLYYTQYSNGKTVRFDIEDNKITTDSKNKLNYKGSIKNGTVLINNKGEVTVCINDGKHAAYKNYKDTKVTVVDSKTCTVPENKYIVYLDNESTVTELSNQELTAKIEELEAKINSLETEKSNQTDVTNSINNLSNQHASDINSINFNVNKINGDINKLNESFESRINTFNITGVHGSIKFAMSSCIIIDSVAFISIWGDMQGVFDILYSDILPSGYKITSTDFFGAGKVIGNASTANGNNLVVKQWTGSSAVQFNTSASDSYSVVFSVPVETVN